MITSIKAFKDKLNENLLIPRRSKDERNIKLLQINYKKLCTIETLEGRIKIDSSYDFPDTFDLSKITLKSINNGVILDLNHIPKWMQNIVIHGYFDCSGNELTSLQYCPSIINGYLDCSNNLLTSLQYAPINIDGRFNCSHNDLTSLEGCPTIKLDFDCSYNKLTSLEGCRTIVNGFFGCTHNKLTSLKGAPTSVQGSFDCCYNALKSLQYAPTKVNGDFDCSSNFNNYIADKKFTRKQVEAVSNVKGNIYV